MPCFTDSSTHTKSIKFSMFHLAIAVMYENQAYDAIGVWLSSAI